jgi:hypothetical protein
MSDQRTKEYLVVLERTERDYGAYPRICLDA